MSRRRSSSTRVLDESAVFVAKSPVSSIKQSGNLTGNVRVARDHVAEICNLINSWNDNVIAGSNQIVQIGNVFTDNLGRTKSHADIISMVGPNLLLLSNICSQLEVIVEKIDVIKSALLSLQRLEEFQNRTKPIFLTWSVGKFAEVVQEIYKMHKKELDLKLKIKEELYLCEDSKLFTFYSVAWMQQPYIENSCEFYQKVMKEEAGFSNKE